MNTSSEYINSSNARILYLKLLQLKCALMAWHGVGLALFFTVEQAKDFSRASY